MNKKSIYNITTSDHHIVKSVMDELIQGVDFVNKEQVVTIFGSARIKPDNQIYQNTVNIAELLSTNGLSIMTGGGPGIMEAANKGAYLANGKSYGINVILPNEQAMNIYVNKPFVCEYLFTRKVLLMKNAIAFIIMEGGFGTLDELFETLTLISVGDIKPVPIILFGSQFWFGITDWIKANMLEQGYIDKDLSKIVYLTDDIDKVATIISTNII